MYLLLATNSFWSLQKQLPSGHLPLRCRTFIARGFEVSPGVTFQHAIALTKASFKIPIKLICISIYAWNDMFRNNLQYVPLCFNHHISITLNRRIAASIEVEFNFQDQIVLLRHLSTNRFPQASASSADSWKVMTTPTTMERPNMARRGGTSLSTRHNYVMKCYSTRLQLLPWQLSRRRSYTCTPIDETSKRWSSRRRHQHHRRCVKLCQLLHATPEL